MFLLCHEVFLNVIFELNSSFKKFSIGNKLMIVTLAR
jgi:hypothetical protein